jgi:uncharacterized protein DUF4430
VKVAAAAVVVAAAGAAGCASGGGHGTATVWVTRDRGARVLLQRTVPAGLTAMQGLDRVADVKTRYAGRFVQAIDGVSGSLSARRDWFYFVNGYEADRSAAEYRLHAGDVEWWDYRSWRSAMRQPVVVGAFPEPFLHGYDGKRLPVVVAGPPGAATRRLARLLRAQQVVVTRRFAQLARRKANLLIVQRSSVESFRALGAPSAPGAPVTFVYAGDPAKLARRPQAFRFRYTVP